MNLPRTGELIRIRQPDSAPFVVGEVQIVFSERRLNPARYPQQGRPVYVGKGIAVIQRLQRVPKPRVNDRISRQALNAERYRSRGEIRVTGP